MTLKFLKDVGDAVSSPFKHAGKGVEGLFKSSGKVVNTLHDDVKGITKGAFSLGKDVTGGFNQLTSPVGLIAIAGIIVLVLVSSRAN